MIDAPPSPFIPGSKIQLAWDSTALGWAKQCPQKYYYRMIEGWRAKDESVHLRFGSIYHASLERYDRLQAEGVEHEEALRTVVHEAMISSHPWPYEHVNKTRENLLRSIIWYLEAFQHNNAKTIILANGKPAVELSFKFEIEDEIYGQPIILCGHLDRLLEFAGDTYTSDRKTTTSTPSGYFFERYNPDNQMSLYSIAGQVMWQLPISGVIIDAAQVAVGFTRFERGITYRTPDQLEEWLHDAVHYMHEATRWAETGHYPKNDTACNMFGGCEFRKICSKAAGVREIFLNTHFEKTNPWNPMEPR